MTHTDVFGLPRPTTEKLWNAMGEYEVPSALKRAVISTYGTCQSKVRVGSGEREWFDKTQTRKPSFPYTIHNIHELGDQRRGHNPKKITIADCHILMHAISQSAASEGKPTIDWPIF